MQDFLFQNLSTVQDDKQPTPKSLAAATTLAPETFVTIVTGTTNVGTITPPVTNQHLLAFVFTDASPGDFLTTGNIRGGLTTIAQYNAVLLVYEPIAAKYYICSGL
jgi:hypothetical protein